MPDPVVPGNYRTSQNDIQALQWDGTDSTREVLFAFAGDEVRQINTDEPGFPLIMSVTQEVINIGDWVLFPVQDDPERAFGGDNQRWGRMSDDAFTTAYVILED